MAKRVKIGDVIEFSIDGNYSYALFTHKHRTFNALLRVNNIQFKERPTNFFGLFNDQPPSFSTFFPLQAAVNRDLVTIVENIDVPKYLSPFPIFRCSAGFNFSSSKTLTWYLWDGENEKEFGCLTPEIQKLPTRGISNDTYIIEKIKQNWLDEYSQ